MMSLAVNGLIFILSGEMVVFVDEKLKQWIHALHYWQYSLHFLLEKDYLSVLFKYNYNQAQTTHH